MNKQRAAELYELADRLSKLDVNTLSEQQLAERNVMIARLKEEVQGVAEGREEFNQAVMQPGFKFKQEINGVVYKVVNKMGMPEMVAMDKQGQVIGAATFWEHPTLGGLESLSTHVDKAWQGRGIAANMYTVMRMLGVNINPSANRTAMGKGMWAKWSQQGDAKHIKNLNPKVREQNVTVAQGQQGVAEGSMNEFAQTGGDDREPNEEEILRKLAAQWWHGDADPRAERTLASMGWEIGQDESGEPNAAVFVIRAGDINGNSYISFGEDDLDMNEGVAEGTDPEYDDEAGMSHNSLRTISRAVEGLMTTIKPGDNLPEWVQAKLSIAEEDLVTIWDYLLSEKESKVQESKKPSPKLTPVEMKKTDPVSEEINTEAYERLQKVFAFKNYES